MRIFFYRKPETLKDKLKCRLGVSIKIENESHTRDNGSRYFIIYSVFFIPLHAFLVVNKQQLFFKFSLLLSGNFS